MGSFLEHIDINGQRLQRLGSNGGGIGQFSSNGGGIGQFGVTDIVSTPDGILWTLDSGNKRIQKFTPQPFADLPADYDERYQLLNLYDVDVAGTHYQATLQQQGSLYRLLTLNPAFTLYSSSAHFDSRTNLLTIPLVRVYGKDYQASFKLVDNYLFQLLSATPK